VGAGREPDEHHERNHALGGAGGGVFVSANQDAGVHERGTAKHRGLHCEKPSHYDLPRGSLRSLLPSQSPDHPV